MENTYKKPIQPVLGTRNSRAKLGFHRDLHPGSPQLMLCPTSLKLLRVELVPVVGSVVFIFTRCPHTHMYWVQSDILKLRPTKWWFKGQPGNHPQSILRTPQNATAFIQGAKCNPRFAPLGGLPFWVPQSFTGKQRTSIWYFSFFKTNPSTLKFRYFWEPPQNGSHLAWGSLLLRFPRPKPCWFAAENETMSSYRQSLVVSYPSPIPYHCSQAKRQKLHLSVNLDSYI